MSVGEFDLIRQYFDRQQQGRGVLLGIGDDCALLDMPAGKQLAVSMDTLVADVHFPARADPEQIAERALRVNLSDLAAMGAEPLWFTLALTLPESDADWLDGFSRGLFQAANEYNIALVGGDTTRGPLSITIQVQGAVAAQKALTRGGASEGDSVWVTGSLGDGAAALALIMGQLSCTAVDEEYLLSRFYRPEPRLKAGQLLGGLASAALDISDGLIGDLAHICRRSNVAANIHLERLPLSAAVTKNSGREQALNWALGGGDDYELCFTVPPAQLQKVEALLDIGQLRATRVGDLVEGSGVTCFLNGERLNPPAAAYNHFQTQNK